jgi:hypothetical protein
MATERQIIANRQNAKSSTGPRTDYGKRRSRRNAMRHGLTAETVIDVFEDPVAYRALQRAIYTDYRPRSNFELQLVGRLVSLIWRLRRATAIESGMLTIQATASRKRKVAREKDFDPEKLRPFYELIPSLAPQAQTELERTSAKQNSESRNSADSPEHNRVRTKIAESFIRLSRLDSDIFERLGRYEMRLWRQTLQTILVLNSIDAHTNQFSDSVRNYSSAKKSVDRRLRIHWPPFVPSE